MFQLEVLICDRYLQRQGREGAKTTVDLTSEFVAIYGFATSAVVSCEIATLQHELRNSHFIGAIK